MRTHAWASLPVLNSTQQEPATQQRSITDSRQSSSYSSKHGGSVDSIIEPMRSYYFHLRFEICTAAHVEEKQLVLDLSVIKDVFQTPLPHHSRHPWSQLLNVETANNHNRINRVKKKSQDVKVDPPTSQRSRQTAVLHSKSKQASTLRKDWRYNNISLISIDMDQPDKGLRRYGSGKSASQDNPSDMIPGGLATKGKYVPSDPSTTELGWGIVHLYRDAEQTSNLHEDDANNTAITKSHAIDSTFDSQACSTLCILAVPSYMSPSDLLGYVGEQTREDVSHFRLIRTGRANKYMVLMKFRDAKKAQVWQKEWNGKPFNTMEPEYCHVVFIQSVTFQVSDQSEKPTSFPNMNNDPFLPSTHPASMTGISSNADTSLSSTLTTKPIAPPTPALIELPTCPVCLERMDESTGLLIILCQHVFHCACLEKWRGTGCPVCRYTQSNGLPGLNRGLPSTGDGSSSCSVCQSENNLWICLICGNVGCGRYDSAHAYEHYNDTKHCYAMDIGTQHVWDYAGDGYVHRLIQSKADGKLVDLPAASSGAKNTDSGMSAYGADMVPREKMDAMGNEYAYLLTNQLDSQRTYFEEQLERAVDKATAAAAAAETAASTIKTLVEKLERLESSHEAANDQIKSLEKESARAKLRSEKSDALARKMGNDWKEEKTVNDSLMERIKFLDMRIAEEKQKREQLQAEKADLEDQNRDLTFFISSGDKLREAGEDIIQGTVEVPVPEPASSSGKKPRRKRK